MTSRAASGRALLLAIVALAGPSLLAACAASRPEARAQAGARAEVRDSSGRTLGVATLIETAAGVSISMNLVGLPPGGHAIHLHETGRCEPPFASAGAHLNPARRAHGLRNPRGPHLGDLPNLPPASGDTVRYFASTASLAIASGPRAVLDDDGASIVIHERADDDITDPAGNSGARIACGVVRRTQ